MGEMDLYGCAKEFQELTGIPMNLGEKMAGKTPGGGKWLVSKSKIIGIAVEHWTEDFLGAKRKGMVDLDISEMRFEKLKNGTVVVSHPRVESRFLPFFLGAAFLYMNSKYKDSHVYAHGAQEYPLLMRARPLGERYKGCALLVAPFQEGAGRGTERKTSHTCTRVAGMLSR